MGLRREHAALHTGRFFTGGALAPGARPDLAWYGSDGVAFDHARWHDPATRTLQMVRSTPTGPGPDDASTVLLVINGSLDPVDVTLGDDRPTRWELTWDSAWEHPDERHAEVNGSPHPVTGDLVVVEPLTLRVYVAV